MTITAVKETSYDGMYKVSQAEGTAFFVRAEYLPGILFDTLVPGAEFHDAEEDELFDAGLCCAAELKAVSYLARSEQSRMGLMKKLLEKGHDRSHVLPALDFLEQKGYLSDVRFARSWLNTRKINHLEGRTRLLAELQGRGISREIAAAAVDEFFTENDEDETCRRAYERFAGQGKSGEKLVAAMQRAGFSYKMLRRLEISE